MSFRSPHEFAHDLDALEAVERSTARFVSHAVHDLLPIAAQQFAGIDVGSGVGDRANYLGEDLTRLALDRVGAARVVDGRLFGTTDYKLASYQFLPDFAVRQALFVDSKAEKNALNVARVQVTQTSLEIRQLRDDTEIAVRGRVPPVWASQDGLEYLPTTVFVKYHYRDVAGVLELSVVSVVSLPHAFLQDVYNPNAGDRIWNVGPDSPARGENFRTRVNFTLLRQKAAWRVQQMRPGAGWEFLEEI